jgi:hypothetical protein
VVPWSSMNQTTGRTRSRRASWLIWHWYFLPLVTEMPLWIHIGVLLALTYSYTAWHFLSRMTHKVTAWIRWFLNHRPSGESETPYMNKANDGTSKIP